MDPLAKNIYEYFAAVAKARSAERAIFFKREGKWQDLSFGEVYSQSILLGNALRSYGIKPADRIAIMIGNQPEWPISFMAAQYIGAVAVPIDINLSSADIKKEIGYSGAVAVLTAEKTRVDLSQILPDLKVYLVDSREFKRQLKAFSAVENKEMLREIGPAADDTTAAMFYTSGTTSEPKAVVCTQKNLLSNLRSFRKLGIIKPGYVFISLLPLHHTYSFMVTCLVPLLEGGHISYPSVLNSEEIIDCIKATKVDVMAGVPRFFDILHRGIKDRLDKEPPAIRAIIGPLQKICWLIRRYLKLNLSKILFSKLHHRMGYSLNHMISGGARLDPRIAYDFFMWGYTMLEGYGLTETSPVVTFNTPSVFRIGSVGKPIPEVEVKIVDPDGSGIGEIAVCGLNIMKGYYKRPEETNRVIKNGWFFSGDLGHIDKQGFVYITGRRDEILVLGSGKKVNPEEIESHYSSSPYIKEICVNISKGGPYAPPEGALTAVIVPDEKKIRADGQADIEGKMRQVLAGLSRELNTYQRIQGLVIRNSPLPRTAMGKLMRHKISCERPDMPVRSAERGKGPSAEDPALLSSDACKKTLKFVALYVKKKSVNLNDHIELDLGLDSLGRIELLMELGKFWNIQLSDSQALELFYANTIKELILRAKPFVQNNEH
ncbi:MAG: AMP-binding protein [Candidatus Omnitrophota bacterium]|nr:AMP-binding protein [Candidatus Omnitrophota bacterium]